MEDNHERVLHPVVVLVPACQCLFILFLLEVLLNAGDHEYLVCCRVVSRERLGRKRNYHWLHVSDSLGDVVDFFELEMARNIVEGPVKLGGIMQSCVIKDIILDLALVFFPGCSHGMVLAVALAVIVVVTIIVGISFSPVGG